VLEPAVRAPLKAGGAWLVRADGYVACTAANDDIKAIDLYLRAVLQHGSPGDLRGVYDMSAITLGMEPP
jgi:hypothetical protein